jgi:hypothetical protein
MHEYVFAAFTLYEPVTFGGIEPLNCPLFFHAASTLIRIIWQFVRMATAGTPDGTCNTSDRKTPGRTRLVFARLAGITTTNCGLTIASFSSGRHHKNNLSRFLTIVKLAGYLLNINERNPSPLAGVRL